MITDYGQAIYHYSKYSYLLLLVRALSAYPLSQVSIDMQAAINWHDLSGSELVPFLKSLDTHELYLKEIDYIKKFTQLKEVRL